MRLPLLLVTLAFVLALPASALAASPKIAEPGPCTQSAALGMPEGDRHDHDEPAQHQGLFCRIKQVAFLPLTAELAAKPDVMLGEMDVKADIAAVTVLRPEAGLLFFDVRDPANPRFLSWYRHLECQADDGCGAYVDLTADAKYAVLSVQIGALVPPALLDGKLGTHPGVALIDITDPTAPTLAQEYDVVSVGGVHTARTHVVPEGPNSGEYVSSIANSVGIDIARLVDTPAGRRIVPMGRIDDAGAHDTFTQIDPLDGKPYLYIAGGFGHGFRVFDVSDPMSPVELGRWDISPQCANDWYAHTIDVTHRGGRRYVTLPAEGFSFGQQSAEDKGEGCGDLQGNGDRAVPLWIVDATDFSALADAQKTLVSTWSNPAGREAGPLTFSPHNQQIVGNRIYLSHYHGGVFVLDASGAFSGNSARPKEIGWAVPAGQTTRPVFQGNLTFEHNRSDFWDVVFWKGHLLTADIKGGLYSLQFEGDRAVPAGAAGGGTPLPVCDDRSAPTSKFASKGLRITRTGLRLRGRSNDSGCEGEVARTLVSVALLKNRRCRFLATSGRLDPARSCTKSPGFLGAAGEERWSVVLRARLPRGTYRVASRAIDAAGNVEKPRFRRAKVR